MFLAIVEKYPSEPITSLGSYMVQWKRYKILSKLSKYYCLFLLFRLNSDTDSVLTTLVPSLPVDYIPLFLKINLPAYGLVRTPLLVSYEFHNRSHQLVQLDVTMEASEAFMFAGYKQVYSKSSTN